MAVIDFSAIKERIQSVLETANTTTASTDLSNGLSARIQKVVKINPERIPIQANIFNYVTIFVDSKDIDETAMAANQTNVKRKATVDLKILGVVWNPNVTALDEDAADNDCEKLMENVEHILRSDPTINSNAIWSHPTGVTYHSGPVAEESHMRAGIMNYRAVIFY